VRVIDVMHLGRPHVIGCWEVDGVLVDPGPESSLRTVLDALGDEQPRAVLLTHIHLDHAAATGALVRRWPDLEVYVHERGAPHLIDPSKLLASAERLYGDDMQRLWGEILPVPEANVRALGGGETVLGMRVAYTPGHASHHVCYLQEESGTAFVGDVAACRIPPSQLVMPPTPPPDIDVPTWEGSLDVIAGWSDWVASNQIITRNLRDIGINSNVALEPDWGAWWPNASAGKFPTLLWQGGSQGSPYGYFYANLSRNAFIPKGQDASPTGNWEHFSDEKATSLLNQWKVTLTSKADAK